MLNFFTLTSYKIAVVPLFVRTLPLLSLAVVCFTSVHNQRTTFGQKYCPLASSMNLLARLCISSDSNAPFFSHRERSHSVRQSMPSLLLAPRASQMMASCTFKGLFRHHHKRTVRCFLENIFMLNFFTLTSYKIAVVPLFVRTLPLLSLASVCSQSVRTQPTTAPKYAFASSRTASARHLCLFGHNLSFLVAWATCYKTAFNYGSADALFLFRFW